MLTSPSYHFLILHIKSLIKCVLFNLKYAKENTKIHHYETEYEISEQIGNVFHRMFGVAVIKPLLLSILCGLCHCVSTYSSSILSLSHSRDQVPSLRFCRSIRSRFICSLSFLQSVYSRRSLPVIWTLISILDRGGPLLVNAWKKSKFLYGQELLILSKCFTSYFGYEETYTPFLL